MFVSRISPGAGAGHRGRIPDGTTLWLFRETLAKAGLVEKLFERFGQHLEAKGAVNPRPRR
jgi:IS5 family transposase